MVAQRQPPPGAAAARAAKHGGGQKRHRLRQMHPEVAAAVWLQVIPIFARLAFSHIEACAPHPDLLKMLPAAVWLQAAFRGHRSRRGQELHAAAHR